MKCNSCGNDIQDNFKFCPFCGAEANKALTCPSCRGQIKPEWAACPFCGASLKGQYQQPAQPQQPQQPQRPQQQPFPGNRHGYSGGSSRQRRRKGGFLGRLFSS